MVNETNKNVNQIPEFTGSSNINIKKNKSNLLLIDK